MKFTPQYSKILLQTAQNRLFGPSLPGTVVCKDYRQKEDAKKQSRTIVDHTGYSLRIQRSKQDFFAFPAVRHPVLSAGYRSFEHIQRLFPAALVGTPDFSLAGRGR